MNIGWVLLKFDLPEGSDPEVLIAVGERIGELMDEDGLPAADRIDVAGGNISYRPLA